ncbi:SHQ1-domain-containing protein [Russula earlei]|uniref:SHQ1-domain-containing protein n=1 Tax=Russula earlei TaxID=71964 RepID=A0ACC0UBG5_9AGAM|nr:SHQ1-domain-containing protein [Russula earlei]
MITPRFSCSQNDRSVIVSVYCPAVRASEIEIHVDHALLSLHVAPYFLRLNFPASVVEDNRSSAVYDPASGYLTLTLTKLNPGVVFPDLDLLGKLLAPPAQGRPRNPTIEVLGSGDNPGYTADLGATERNEILEAAANEWTFPQTASDTLPVLETSLRKPYGFLNAYSGYFLHVGTTENEVNELGADAETLSPSERRIRRLRHEDSKWNPEHYMADYADNEQMEELLAWTHPHLESPSTSVVFTEAENAAMLRLPRKEYLPSPQETHDLYLALLTLLFAYAYDARTTLHDPTPESAWTIAALTPAFSALDPPPYSPPHKRRGATVAHELEPVQPEPALDFGFDSGTPHELATTLIPSYRRALAFPLYRSWALADGCRMDAAYFLIRGTRTVLRCLLELRAILEGHEVYYVYSRIWLDDFCRWIQAGAREDTLIRLGKIVSHLGISKDSIGWDLVVLEHAVQTTKESKPDSDDDVESEKPALL